MDLYETIAAMEEAAPKGRAGNPNSPSNRRMLAAHSPEQMREALAIYARDYAAWRAERGHPAADWWMRLSADEKAQARRVFDLAVVLRKRLRAAEREARV